MRVVCHGIRDGWIEDRFGSKGDVWYNGMPGLSPGFSILDAPESAECFAAILDDYDAVSASGFVWVHWLISDLGKTEVAEGASRSDPDLTEGSNSWFSELGGLDREQATGYGGPDPPNGTHRYELRVYALDGELGLEPGFRLNDLHFAMEGRVLASCGTVGRYSGER